MWGGPVVPSILEEIMSLPHKNLMFTAWKWRHLVHVCMRIVYNCIFFSSYKFFLHIWWGEGIHSCPPLAMQMPFLPYDWLTVWKHRRLLTNMSIEMYVKWDLNEVNQSCSSCCIHGFVTCSELRATFKACTNDLCHGFGRTAISSRCAGNATGAGSFKLSRGSRNTKSTVHT